MHIHSSKLDGDVIIPKVLAYGTSAQWKTYMLGTDWGKTNVGLYSLSGPQYSFNLFYRNTATHGAIYGTDPCTNVTYGNVMVTNPDNVGPTILCQIL